MRRARRETGIYYLKRKKQKMKELRSNKYYFKTSFRACVERDEKQVFIILRIETYYELLFQKLVTVWL